MNAFTVRPFAFMRLTHEALRAGFASLEQGAAADDLDAVASAWTGLRGAIAVHKRHEEEAFFPLLDATFDGAVTKAGLRETHDHEEAHEARLEVALADRDVGAVRAAIAAWAPSFEAHLVEEEAVMMPLTQRVADTVEGRAQAVHGILAVDWDELEQVHLPYVARSLGQTKPYGPVRMFVAAVQASAGDRYDRLQPVLRAHLPAATVEALVAHGHLGAMA